MVHAGCLFTSVSLGKWKLHLILLVSAVPTRDRDTAFNCVLQTSSTVTHRKKRILYHDLLYMSITHTRTELKQKFHGTKFTMTECHTLLIFCILFYSLFICSGQSPPSQLTY